MIFESCPNRIICILLFLITGLFIRCESPFAMRNPEPPSTVRSTWVQPFSPELVFTNLNNAISEKNVDNYVRCLVDTTSSERHFVFTPEPEVMTTFSRIFLYWNRSAEKTVMQQLFSAIPDDSTCYVKFTEDATDIVAADSAVFQRIYHLEVHHTESGFPAVYDGYSEFWLAPDQTGEWAIYRWIDHRLNENPSWSSLKAALGS